MPSFVCVGRDPQGRGGRSDGVEAARRRSDGAHGGAVLSVQLPGGVLPGGGVREEDGVLPPDRHLLQVLLPVRSPLSISLSTRFCILEFFVFFSLCFFAVESVKRVIDVLHYSYGSVRSRLQN